MLTMIWFRSTPWPARARGLVGAGGVASQVGAKRSARIVLSEEPIPGASLSEAEVIGEVFRMTAVEKKSCWVIAARLNDLGIPCAYARDDRLVLHGKRKQRTSGLWRPGRVRDLIVSKTYMGVHEFGNAPRADAP